MASITSVALGIGLGFAAGAGVVMSATPAGADPPIDCSNGVIVAVDFSPWSETLNSVCDSTLPANGVSALQSAGFGLTGVTGYGLQFICQIDDDPPAESCATTPSANAYWSLWYAEAGQTTWTYSLQGAEGLEPQAGSIEAWVFGGASGGGQPAIPAPRALDSSTPTTSTGEPTPPPTSATESTGPTETTGPTGPTAAPLGPPAGSSAGSSGGGGSGSQHVTGDAAGAGAAASATTSTTIGPGRSGSSTSNATGFAPAGAPRSTSGRSSTSLKIVDSAPASATRHLTGSPVPFLVGAAAVAVLAGSGGLIAWRRRRTG